ATNRLQSGSVRVGARMPRHSEWNEAIAALAGGATLLTGSARLARRAARAEAERRQAQGETIWPGSTILPWSAWLRRLYVDALVGGAVAPDQSAALLSPAQVEAVWRQAIEADEPHGTLLQVQPAA